MSESPAVVTRALTHRFDERVALDGVDLKIARGTLYGLLGPNGSGKTTLFRILSTVTRATHGSAAVFGHDVVDRPADVRRKLGTVFQHPALDPELTVRENLAVFGALHGMSGQQVRQRTAQLLETLGVADRLNERVSRLSGGLARRVDLARGLMHEPDLLLLDEPTTGLDPTARSAFWTALASLRTPGGLTVLAATHLFDEAAACDQIAILDEGRIVTSGNPTELVNAVGGEALWIESDDGAAVLRSAPEGVDIQRVGDRFRVVTSDPAATLAQLYQSAGSAIRSAVIRKPSLEDVYMTATGHRWQVGKSEVEA